MEMNQFCPLLFLLYLASCQRHTSAFGFW